MPKNTTNPQTYFSRIPAPNIPRSMFDRSENLITTMEKGILQPLFFDEVLPADTFNFSVSAFARLLTPLKPFMDNLYIDVHAWFVPNRLVFDKFVNMQGEIDDPEASPQPVYSIPQMEFDLHGGLSGIISGSPAACFGLPITNAGTGALTHTVSALPFRAVRCIYDNFYRDQNHEKKTLTNIGETNDKYYEDGYATHLKRWKAHDYFTSALPWAQKGDAVSIGIGGTIPITGTIGGTGQVTNTNVIPHRGATNYGWNYDNNTQKVNLTSIPTTGAISAKLNDPSVFLNAVTHSLSGNLSSATAITINEFRQAVTLQQYLERDARTGTRYIESLYARFGVVNPDFRLMRPEFLGATRIDINIIPIAQTSSSDSTSPQANLAAMATGSSNKQLKFVKTFTEHGMIIILGSLVADLNYQQGIERKWTRKTQFDFYDPLFANLGEQAILNKEIFFTDTTVDDDVFGYQEAWADYRYSKNKITNLMNSNATTNIDIWHLAEDYVTTPTLGKTFLQYQTPIERVIAVTNEPPIELNMFFKNKCARAIPVRSVPGLRRF